MKFQIVNHILNWFDLDTQNITWLRDNIISRYNYTVEFSRILTDGGDLAQLEQLKNELLEVIVSRTSARPL
jgi:hypothetical protein